VVERQIPRENIGEKGGCGVSRKKNTKIPATRDNMFARGAGRGPKEKGGVMFVGRDRGKLYKEQLQQTKVGGRKGEKTSGMSHKKEKKRIRGDCEPIGDQ